MTAPAPAPDRTPNLNMRPAKAIVPMHRAVRKTVDKISSQSGGSDGNRTMDANGAEKGMKVAIRSKGLSGADKPSGMTAAQAIKTNRIGVVSV